MSVVANLVSESELRGFGRKRRKDLSVDKNPAAWPVVGSWVPRCNGVPEIIEMRKKNDRDLNSRKGAYCQQAYFDQPADCGKRWIGPNQFHAASDGNSRIIV